MTEATELEIGIGRPRRLSSWSAARRVTRSRRSPSLSRGKRTSVGAPRGALSRCTWRVRRSANQRSTKTPKGHWTMRRYQSQGTNFARLAIARAAFPGADRIELGRFCEARWGLDGATIAKATIVGGTTVDPATGDSRLGRSRGGVSRERLRASRDRPAPAPLRPARRPLDLGHCRRVRILEN